MTERRDRLGRSRGAPARSGGECGEVRMGFNNPDMPWSELERVLSGAGRRRPDGRRRRVRTTARTWWTRSPSTATAATPRPGPASARAYQRAGAGPAADGAVPYAELHCHTNFSFLDGASHPEELAEEAARLGLTALAVTDHDGFYGVVRFAEAARELGLPTVFGAELSLGPARPAERRARPGGRHLLVLARGPEGYARLCRVIAEAQLRGGEKGRPVYDLERGRRRAARPRAGAHRLPQGARAGARCSPTGSTRRPGELDRLTALFGAEHVAVELTDHGDPYDGDRNDALAALAAAAGLPTVATNNVHYATPGAAPAGHRAGRGPGPAQPGRDRRLAARGGHRAPAQRRGDGGPVRRVPGRGGPRPPSSARELRLRPAAGRARSLPDYPVPSRAHRDELAAQADLRRGARALRPAARRTRRRTRSSTTSWT